MQERSARAKSHYVPTTRESYHLAIDVEKLVAPGIKGRVTPIHHPFDIIVDDCDTALEVKTVLLTSKDMPKITMRKVACSRKHEYLREKKLCAFTLAVDLRGPSPRFYLREGIGSYRLEHMKACTSLKHVRRQLVGSFRQRAENPFEHRTT